MNNPVYDMLSEERAEERSLTWKERHAKGVPVKMEYQEWRSVVLGTKHVTGTNRRHNWQEVWVECRDEEDDRVLATFRNFRYKHEWLEKKGSNEKMLHWLKTHQAL